jgi:4-hydroxybenzoate polyprenyltransferase
MRAFLVLGRVSNLPTVWSNCLAAWLLGGGGGWDHFALLCLGGDAPLHGRDVPERRSRRGFRSAVPPERPIVAGQISARTVWVLSSGWLVAGWLLFFLLGRASILAASFLLLAIVLYDVCP